MDSSSQIALQALTSESKKNRSRNSNVMAKSASSSNAPTLQTKSPLPILPIAHTSARSSSLKNLPCITPSQWALLAMVSSGSSQLPDHTTRLEDWDPTASTWSTNSTDSFPAVSWIPIFKNLPSFRTASAPSNERHLPKSSFPMLVGLFSIADTLHLPFHALFNSTTSKREPALAS